jgi:hypothetical protein
MKSYNLLPKNRKLKEPSRKFGDNTKIKILLYRLYRKMEMMKER